jgi:hypothetical protein
MSFIVVAPCGWRTEGSRNMWRGAYVIQILVQLFGNKVVNAYISVSSIISTLCQLHSANIPREHVSN